MTLLDSYRELDEKDRRRFLEAIQQLQRRSFVLRGGAIRSEPTYAFVEKHEDIVSEYLEMGGWKLHLDRERGVARLYHPEGSGRVHFNKEETLLILVLRLLYHEDRQRASESPEAVVRVGDLREKLHALLPPAAVRPFLSNKLLGTRLRRLAQFGMIEFTGSSYSLDNDTTITLEPTLEHVASLQSLDETRARLDALVGAAGGAPAETPVESDESPNEPDGEEALP